MDTTKHERAEWKFAAWTIKGKALELPCRYRIVPKIPWLKEFGSREGAQ
jgi:hypothetical protein